MDLGTQLSGSQSAKCVRRVHGYVNSVGFGVDGFGVATGRMTVHPPVSMVHVTPSWRNQIRMLLNKGEFYP